MTGLGRRGFLGAGLGVAGAAGVGALGGYAAADAATDAGRAAGSGQPSYRLWGRHQPGIITAAQDRLHFAAFDVTTTSKQDLVALMAAWTIAADRMMQGLPAGNGAAGDYDLPPDDTGEAVGLPPAGLTLTFGVGRSLFDDRFGLADRVPAGLEPLPHFPGDNLDLAVSDGDLCVQACADDPQVAVHAIRNLARIGFGTVAMRWSQLGFGRTSTTTAAQSTPRNLFGFKDGTMNVRAEQEKALRRHVWAGPDDQAWMQGGSYLVARRIAMTIETWDRQSLAEQEKVVGRTKREGAPLSGGVEETQPDVSVTGSDGEPLVDPHSHVAIAHPDANDGARMLRRGYNFVDGTTRTGGMDAGLFFLAFVTDPRTHYTPIQLRMSSSDLMQEYVQHTGSGLFAVPPGARRPGDFVGQSLLLT